MHYHPLVIHAIALGDEDDPNVPHMILEPPACFFIAHADFPGEFENGLPYAYFTTIAGNERPFISSNDPDVVAGRLYLFMKEVMQRGDLSMCEWPYDHSSTLEEVRDYIMENKRRHDRLEMVKRGEFPCSE